MIRRLAGATLALLAACAQPEPKQPPPKALLVQAQPAQLARAEGAAWVAGTLMAAQRAVISTRLAARVVLVRAEEGAVVHRGEVLIRLGDDEIRAQLLGARTALATAEAQHRRVTTLAGKGAATHAELELAESQRDLARAQSAAAHANLEYTEIRAPFDGMVQSKRVQPGDLVVSGQPLLELVGGGLEIAVNVSEDEVRVVRQGDLLRFEAGAHRGEAEVIAIAPGGDAASHRGLLRAKLREPDGLRSGSFARLELPGRPSTQKNVEVPRSAVVQRGDLTGVFVVQGDRAELRWISLGLAEGERIEVRAGVHPGELVVNPPGDLRDGQRVEVASVR